MFTCVSVSRPSLRFLNVVGYIKGKSAITIARRYRKKKRNFTGEKFWARGYFVTTVGLDEAMVKEYIANQSKRDRYFDQGNLFDE